MSIICADMFTARCLRLSRVLPNLKYYHPVCGYHLFRSNTNTIVSGYVNNLKSGYSCNHYNIKILRSKSYGKSKKNQKTDNDEDDVDDDADIDWTEDDTSLKKDSKIRKINVNSVRADLILKAGLAVGRNKIEKYFYQSKIRLNGDKLLKKSVSVNVGDEIDLVKGFSTVNPNHIIVSRVEVLELKALEMSISVTIRRFKSLVIENYKDPYKESTAEED